MKKNIDTKKEAVTKEFYARQVVEREYSFPQLGVSVVATSYKEALSKAKKLIKK